ncbi:tetratricopeptide repeat protein [Flavobacterium sp. 3HN19-14]|uniref:tetratricopeptide repeat protein n=1 Tax=Flavobacterium sp. 3HN19-14 TaxID=3448133 RepID=UPI003EE239AD
MKQKAIENYDKAITALEKCRTLNPDNPEVYNELGKNYLFLKDYKKSYESFAQAAQLDPKNKWYLAGMYDVCYQTQDDEQSIVLVKKLIEFDEGYKEDLTSLYMRTGQYDKALAMINELNDKVGKSEKRELYKADILKDSRFQDTEKTNLLDQIKKNPKEESNYIALIFLYSDSNQEEKALEIAKKLEIEIPTSDWAQVSLFKFHLSKNEGKEAVASMNQILKSNKIDNKIKHRVINEFLIFTKTNPQFDADLQKAIGYFDGDKEAKTAKEIGKFHQGKKDWDKAIEYYEIDNKSNPNDMETILLLLQAYVEKGQFDKVAAKADDTIEMFPQQPELYYYSGLAHNQQKEFKKAKDILETGIDFLVDDKALEINFNIQLGEAYSGLGDLKKKEAYFLKADKLLKQKK